MKNGISPSTLNLQLTSQASHCYRHLAIQAVAIILYVIMRVNCFHHHVTEDSFYFTDRKAL